MIDVCVFKGKIAIWVEVIKDRFQQEVRLEMRHEVVLGGKELSR